MTATTATLSSAPSTSSTSDWLLLVVPGVIWGASFLFIAEGLEAIGPYGVAFVRILVGFATLALFPSARRSIPRADWGRIALLGVVWMAFPLSLFPFAEQRVTSALTGMLNGAVPLFAALVAAGVSRRLPGRGIAAGLAVGLAGAVLIALPQLNQGRSSTAGVLMILAALVSYGFAINLARPLQLRHGAVPVIWRAQAAALILTAPLGLPDLIAARWTPAALFSMLALGVLGTGVAFVVTAIAAGRLGATRASSTAYLIPPVALLLGVLVRSEQVAALSVLGGAVCVAGAWLMRRAQSDAPPAAPLPAPRIAAGPMNATSGELMPQPVVRPIRLYLTRTRAIMGLALLLVPFAGAGAQAARGSGPNFLIFRYASQSSLSMYSGYTAGPLLVVFGMLHNPRTSYEEVMAGIGKPLFAANGNGLTIAAAAAYTNTGWYGQLYLVPSVRLGAVTLSGTAQGAVPLSAGGTQAVYISPGNVLVDLGGGFSAGLGYYASFERGSRPGHTAGPALQRAVPHGSVTLEMVKNLAAAKDEVRLTLRSSF